ncbi:GIY-YIG nuclease family protein [Streptomyces hydrogenans]|uniref:GIY-YIG nuclease family protein n=1 Tax=Streptomyces TaxID=1883 RepID=UPI003624D7ED
MENLTVPRHSQLLPASQDEAVREEVEVTSRFATDAELDAFGYKGPVVVTQTVRTTFRADGTPIGKTLTVQGGSTVLVRHGTVAEADDDETLPTSPPAGAPAPKVPAPRRERTYLVGMDGSPLTKIGRTTDTVKARLAALQTGQPARLYPLLEVDGDYERALHTRFAEQHVRGEWFDLTPLGDPAAVVVEALAELGAEGLPEFPGVEVGVDR